MPKTFLNKQQQNHNLFEVNKPLHRDNKLIKETSFLVWKVVCSYDLKDDRR